MNAIRWMVLCALTLLLLAEGLAADESWRAVEQPDLKRALEQAPPLKTESLGKFARGVNTFEHRLVPNFASKSWNIIQHYHNDYYGPTTFYGIDLATGKIMKEQLPDGRSFVGLADALGFDGKYYRVGPVPDKGLYMNVYDPATNTLERRDQIIPGLGGERYLLCVGPDGRLYGSASAAGGKVGLYIYDPKLRKVVKDFGAVGPAHKTGVWCRGLGVDDQYAYILSGDVPSYLLAVNLKTGETRVLAEAQTFAMKSGQYFGIEERFPGAWAHVPQDDGSPMKNYWLYHGQMIPKKNETAPWPSQKSPWDKAGPRPEVWWSQVDPDANGNATIWYRMPKDAAKAPKKPPPGAKPEDLGWKAIHLKGVTTYSALTCPLVLLPDGRLYGTGEHYVGTFIFDPKTDKSTYCGSRTGLAPYAQIVHDGKLYLAGYSGGALLVYDPKLPWTLGLGGPPGHRATHSKINPRFLANLCDYTRVALMHNAALGSDGKIYFGGYGEREYHGGGLAWLDPKTERMGGLWKPLSGYPVHYIAAINGGRRIAISTITGPDDLNQLRRTEEAKLFIYEIEQGKIIKEIVPIPKARATGMIAEAAPGRLLGLTVEGAEYGQPGDGILYGVDTGTGEILFRKRLPSSVSIDNYWPHWIDPSFEYAWFVPGPDGFLWTWLKDVLVRVNPKDVSVHVVGRLNPGFLTFVGNDVYLAGQEQLRRMRNIVPGQ